MNGLQDAAPAAVALGSCERWIIRFSRDEPLWSVPGMQEGRARIERWLGAKIPTRMTNPRLEALRRFAIVTRLRGRAGTEETARFLGAGFTQAQADLVAHELSALGPRTRPPLVDYPVLILLSAIAIGTFFLVQDAVRAPLVACIVTGLVLVTVASLTMASASAR